MTMAAEISVMLLHALYSYSIALFNLLPGQRENAKKKNAFSSNVNSSKNVNSDLELDLSIHPECL